MIDFEISNRVYYYLKRDAPLIYVHGVSAAHVAEALDLSEEVAREALDGLVRTHDRVVCQKLDDIDAFIRQRLPERADRFREIRDELYGPATHVYELL